MKHPKKYKSRFRMANSQKGEGKAIQMYTWKEERMLSYANPFSSSESSDSPRVKLIDDALSDLQEMGYLIIEYTVVSFTPNMPGNRHD